MIVCIIFINTIAVIMGCVSFSVRVCIHINFHVYIVIGVIMIVYIIFINIVTVSMEVCVI